jgi:hypothetical protein
MLRVSKRNAQDECGIMNVYEIVLIARRLSGALCSERIVFDHGCNSATGHSAHLP